MGRDDGLGHAVFGHLAGEALDHQDRVLAARDDQVQVALLQGVVRGEGDELAVDRAQPHRGDRPLKRQRRNPQRGRGPVHRQHVAVVLPVAGQHERLHLDLVAEPIGPQRPDGAVHQPGGEDFLGGGPAFAFQEAAGELARRRHALAIVASQGKEVARPRAARGGGHQHDRLAVLHQTTAGGLLGQFAGFERKNGRSDLSFNTCFQDLLLPSSGFGLRRDAGEGKAPAGQQCLKPGPIGGADIPVCPGAGRNACPTAPT